MKKIKNCYTYMVNFLQMIDITVKWIKQLWQDNLKHWNK